MLRDSFQRPLRNLRLSVTDKCNLRCAYCMPEEEYAWLPDPNILSYEEISALVDSFIRLGVRKVRLTGGEPLVRRDLPELVRMLAAKSQIEDLAITTNGVLLREQAAVLKAAGMQRVTISLDTLDPLRFKRLTRRDTHGRVLEGIAAARAVGFVGTKLDTVVLRGVNADELIPLLEFARAHACELRFIEYMDVGGATRWSFDQVVSRAEILEVLSRHYGPIRAFGDPSSAPAERFVLPDGLVFGIIASTTAPFCATCDRARLTADGMFFTCLYARTGLDLRAALRRGAADHELAALIAGTWSRRVDRGAEERLRLHARGPLAAKAELQRDPRLEMHTRGG